MSLSPAEKAILKAAIVADPTMNAFPNTSDGNFALAEYLNAPGTTELWRSDITPEEIASTVTMSAFTSLTAVKQNGLLLMTQGERINATSASVRSSFSDIFGAGATLTALTALAKKMGTRFQIIFSTVDGGANVSTKFGASVNFSDVMEARNS